MCITTTIPTTTIITTTTTTTSTTTTTTLPLGNHQRPSQDHIAIPIAREEARPSRDALPLQIQFHIQIPSETQYEQNLCTKVRTHGPKQKIAKHCLARGYRRSNHKASYWIGGEQKIMIIPGGEGRRDSDSGLTLGSHRAPMPENDKNRLIPLPPFG